MNHKLLFSSTFMLLLLATGSNIMAQYNDGWSQAIACPAWNNPANFTVIGNGGTDYWEGRGGSVYYGMPLFNPSTGATGPNWSNTTYSASELANVGGSCGYGTYATLPNNNKMYAIMSTTSQASGAQANLDPNTGNHIPFVPTQYNTTDQQFNTQLTRSIRVGDGCCSDGVYGASALYYYCTPTPDNALLFIYYACVFNAPGHGTDEDPAFIIRVMKQNAAGQWVQVDYQHFSYYISSTPATGYTEDGTHGDANPVPWGQGGPGAWHSQGSFIYKDWDKVGLNLSNYMYKPLRIEIITYDCRANVHPGYAYIAGECRPMTLWPIDTNGLSILSVPENMMAYEWAASEYGYTPTPILDLAETGVNNYFTFRILADSNQATNEYQIQPEDYRVHYRPNNAHAVIPLTDSIGFDQTIRCRMKSALNPSFPYWSTIYANVHRTASIYTLHAESSDTTLGTVTGGGIYTENSIATLTALTQKDCTFRGWSDGGEDNPYHLSVTSDSTITAMFSRADTVYVHDTLILTDTITITIHDTIYITGIDDINPETMAKIYATNGQITVETEANTDVIIFNIAGQPIAQKPFAQTLWRFDVPTSGTYLVRVGGRTTRRVVVIK